MSGKAPPFTRRDAVGSSAKPVSRHQRLDAQISGPLPGDRPKGDQLQPGLLVEPPRYAGGEECLGLGPEVEPAVMDGIEERLLADTVARREQLLVLAVP